MSDRSRAKQAKPRPFGQRLPSPTNEVDHASVTRREPAGALRRTLATPAPAVTPADILALQRSAGNRAVEQFLAMRTEQLAAAARDVVADPSSVRVGSPNDAAEREAECAASAVTGLPDSAAPAPPHRSRGAEPFASDNGVGPDAARAVAAAARTSGQPLPATLQRKLESSLGADVSDVRLHTSPESNAAAEAVAARAYTVGEDIHFAAGQYDPDSQSGQRLIAHEVAHAIQQGDAPVTRVERDEAGGHTAPSLTRTSSVLQRSLWDDAKNFGASLLDTSVLRGTAEQEIRAQVNAKVPKELGYIDELNDLENYREDNGVPQTVPTYSGLTQEQLSTKISEQELLIASLESQRLAIVKKARADARQALENAKNDATGYLLGGAGITAIIVAVVTKTGAAALIGALVGALVGEYIAAAKGRSAVKAILAKAKEDLKAINTNIKIEKMKLEAMKSARTSAKSAEPQPAPPKNENQTPPPAPAPDVPPAPAPEPAPAPSPAPTPSTTPDVPAGVP